MKSLVQTVADEARKLAAGHEFVLREIRGGFLVTDEKETQIFGTIEVSNDRKVKAHATH